MVGKAISASNKDGKKLQQQHVSKGRPIKIHFSAEIKEEPFSYVVDLSFMRIYLNWKKKAWRVP